MLILKILLLAIIFNCMLAYKFHVDFLSYFLLAAVTLYFVLPHKKSVQKPKSKPIEDLKSPHCLLIFTHQSDWKFAFDCDALGNVKTEDLNTQAQANYKICTTDPKFEKIIFTCHKAYDVMT